MFLISRRVAGPRLESLRASHENKKQKKIEKDKKQGGAQGPGAQRAVRPSAKGGSKGGEVVDRSAGRVVDGPGWSGRSME